MVFKYKSIIKISNTYKLLNQKFRKNKNLQIFLKKKNSVMNKVLRCLIMFSRVLT